MRLLLSGKSGAILALCAGMYRAQSQPLQAGSPSSVSLDSFFHERRMEATLTSGAMFSPFLATKGRPDIDYTLSECQIGRMLSDVKEAGFLRGNFEFVGQVFGGGVFDGAGNDVSGMTLWLRYNFVPKDWHLIPYAQAGGGLTYADVDRRVLGQTFNFNLGLGVGVRCFVARNWSVNIEYRYQHISNADMARHNLGINAQGAILGVSYFF
jgi:Lipid A 3-O-deacylase (PagL)